MSFRDIKKSARRQLHEKMKVPALYIAPDEDPLAVHVRPHSRWLALGEVAGTSFDYAEKQEIVPQIVFDRLEVNQPVRNAIVSVSSEEAYAVDHALPPDGEWVIAKCRILTAAQRVGLPTP